MNASSTPSPTHAGANAHAGRSGSLYVISAPSGAGKTSLVQALLKRRDSTVLSVSHTTRKARVQEVDGQHYHFVERAKFERLRAAGEFLESAEVFGNLYGTSAREVQALAATGKDVLLEIDWQGARQVRAALPTAQSVFVLPPSLDELRRRLHGRATDPEEVRHRRLAQAVDDMSHYREFDFVIVNDQFDHALTELEMILDGQGQALRADRAALAPLVAQLLAT